MMNKTVEDRMATMTVLSPLTIFTTYSISVQAETVDIGDPSEVVVVTTDEDRKFVKNSIVILLYLLVCTLVATSFLVATQIK